MIRDLMLAITETPGDEAALAAAVALARSCQAHLAVVLAVRLPAPMPAPWGYTPSALLDEIHDEIRAQTRSRADALRERLEREDIAFDVRMVEGVFALPQQLLAIEARFADLAVIAAPQRQAPQHAPLFAALLFESGRPVLTVPPHWQGSFPVRRAAVGWLPSREATRALHDALPLLHAAEAVEVICVETPPGEAGHGTEPAADIATHLARHGLKVNVASRTRRSETIATGLLMQAHEAGAELLIAGGYGHSRLREWAFGGTTRDLLDHADLPMLFSH